LNFLFLWPVDRAVFAHGQETSKEALNAQGCQPLEAGVSEHVWTIEEIVALLA
jgi:hypothetical protein